jgi:hypothetical protein
MKPSVNFSNRIKKKISCTALYNIFVYSASLSSSSESAIINGLSDHDAKYLTINYTAAAGN